MSRSQVRIRSRRCGQSPWGDLVGAQTNLMPPRGQIDVKLWQAQQSQPEPIQSEFPRQCSRPGGQALDSRRSLPPVDRQSLAPGLGGREAGSRSGSSMMAVESTLNSLSIDTRVMREILQRIEASQRDGAQLRR